MWSQLEHVCRCLWRAFRLPLRQHLADGFPQRTIVCHVLQSIFRMLSIGSFSRITSSLRSLLKDLTWQNKQLGCDSALFFKSQAYLGGWPLVFIWIIRGGLLGKGFQNSDVRFLPKQDRKHLKVMRPSLGTSALNWYCWQPSVSYWLPKLAVLSLLARPRRDLLTGCMCEHVWACLSLPSRGLTYHRLKDLDFSSLLNPRVQCEEQPCLWTHGFCQTIQENILGLGWPQAVICLCLRSLYKFF